MRRATSIRRERGLTLIELMISLALSLIVLSALVFIYVSSRGTYRGNEAVARVQENGRFALDWLAREIRGAGYFGCASRAQSPEIIADNFTGFGMGFQAVAGAENGSGWTNRPANYLRGDVLYLSGMYGTGANILDDKEQSVNANIKVDRCIGLQKNDLVMADNCMRSTILRVTNDPEKNCPPSSGFITVTDANNVNNANFRLNPQYLRQNRATLVKFTAYAYYIGTNPAGRPSLYRTSADAGNAATEEVVENIESMDLQFGEDLDGDGYADIYRPASQVASWGAVISVRVVLVAVSPDLGAVPQPQTYFVGASNDGTAVGWQTAADTRLRQIFESTVAVRNRLP